MKNLPIVIEKLFELDSSEHIPSDLLSFIALVNNKGFKVTQLFACYYLGWEMDNWGAYAKKEDKSFRITTDHGRIVTNQIEAKNSLLTRGEE